MRVRVAVDVVAVDGRCRACFRPWHDLFMGVSIPHSWEKGMEGKGRERREGERERETDEGLVGEVCRTGDGLV